MPRLYVATHNQHKLREIGEILPGFEIVADDPEGVEENAPDFAGNALIKVRAIAARHRGEWCMADDSGLEVAALGGAPGVRSARYAGEPSNTPANNALLLRNLEGVSDRRANFTCAVALVDPAGREHSVEGRCYGRIAEKAAGAAGFGYDPLFVPDGYDRSFAELSPEQKNAISHRGRALAKAKRIIAGGFRRYAALAGFAFAVLAFAAVWLGGLNQDEGWYLYAANLVGEGKMPYRDFFFTQGPLMPIVYSAFSWVWGKWGLLGARVLTCAVGLAATLFASFLAGMLVPPERKACARTLVFMLLGCNLYHIYYTSTPKTYALASLFVMTGYFLMAAAFSALGARWRRLLLFGAGLSLAFASGARISLGMLLAVCGFGLLFGFRRLGWSFLWFGLGGALGLALVYGPFLLDAGALKGLVAAQRYHAARGGFDIVFTVGSVSRLVRWYLPVFVLFGLGAAAFLSGRGRGESAAANPALPLAFFGFVGVFAVQMLAPFPYEDYQVPVIGLLAVTASALACTAPEGSTFALGARLLPLLVLGLTWACSFGTPQLEDWMTNGQDRFWTLKKEKCELAQLRDVARRIEALDPGGKELLTQDVYIAVETGRKVPHGLEMGPFSMLSDAEWRELLTTVDCKVAALSGYTFAIDPPTCVERPFARQMEYWKLLRGRYELAEKEAWFGQNATPLMILKRKSEAK